MRTKPGSHQSLRITSRKRLLVVCIICMLWLFFGTSQLILNAHDSSNTNNHIIRKPEVIVVETTNEDEDIVSPSNNRKTQQQSSSTLTSTNLQHHDQKQQQQQQPPDPSLYPDSPVVDIEHDLLVCRKGGNMEPPRMSRETFHEQIILPRLITNNNNDLPPPPPPITRESFVCLARCKQYEPELEFSLRYLGGDSSTKYSAQSLIKLCKGGHVPILVKIINNKISWTRCVPTLTATQHWTAVTRELLLLARMVELPNVIFAFETGDFSTPRTQDPHGLNWLYTEPAVIRFVGDSSHSSLLWPTLPFISATAYCDIAHQHGIDGIQKSNFQTWFRPCTSIIDEKNRPRINWNQKENIVFWRGSPTGGTLDVGHRIFTPRTALNERFGTRPGYDVSFAQDAVPPYVDQAFIDSHIWKARLPRNEFGKYKMVISLDGHTASWGLIEKLVQGSVLLIHESLRGYREHYYALLIPYKHFLPVAADFSNLERIRTWVLDHDEQAEEIARNAVELVDDRMRPADTWCYMMRLLTTLGMRMGFDLEVELFKEFKWELMTGEYVSKTL
jgi:hypothetical protein